jgi:branched-chain amino acid transport system substrate-binding protein
VAEGRQDGSAWAFEPRVPIKRISTPLQLTREATTLTITKMFVFILSVTLLAGCGSAPTAIATPTEGALPPATPLPTKTATNIPSATPTATPSPTPSVTPTLSPFSVTIGSGDPVRIGYLLAESLDWGLESLRGVELAIDEFGGSVYDHPVELIGYDTECNKLAAQRAASLLANEPGMLGVIGPSCSGEAIAAARSLMGSGLLLMSPSNSDPSFTAADTHLGGYLRTYPSNAVETSALARFAREQLGASRLATVHYVDNAYSEHVRMSACQAFEDLGGACVSEHRIRQGDVKMEAILSRAASAEPDALLLVLMPPEASHVLGSVRTVPGLESIPILVQESSFGPLLLELAGDHALGAYVSQVTPSLEFESLAYQRYLIGYREKWAEQPHTPYVPFAYDAAMLMLDAIRQAGMPQPDGSLLVDRQAVSDFLFATSDFPGLTGDLSCSAIGDCASSDHGATIFRIEASDPATWNPGTGLSANPVRVWPSDFP